MIKSIFDFIKFDIFIADFFLWFKILFNNSFLYFNLSFSLISFDKFSIISLFSKHNGFSKLILLLIVSEDDEKFVSIELQLNFLTIYDEDLVLNKFILWFEFNSFDIK